MMSKMARNRSALHDVLAQGAFNRDITVIQWYIVIPFSIIELCQPVFKQYFVAWRKTKYYEICDPF